MIQSFCESRLVDSEIWKGLTEWTGTDQREKAIAHIKSSRTLSRVDIEAAYIEFSNHINAIIKAALKGFDSERVVLKYNDDPSKTVTQALPFITFQNAQREWTTYIFMDNYARPAKGTTVLNIQMPKLRDLMRGAIVANGLKRNYDKLTSNHFLQKMLMQIYGQLVFRVLNKKYSFSSDKAAVDQVAFWVNKFFLLRIFGVIGQPDDMDILASKELKHLNEMQLMDAKRMYNEKNPQTISGLLELIRGASKNLSTLDLYSFIDVWSTYYHAPSLLAIDNIEYLIFMIMSLLGGSNIINFQSADVVKNIRNINALDGELYKLII